MAQAEAWGGARIAPLRATEPPFAENGTSRKEIGVTHLETRAELLEHELEENAAAGRWRKAKHIVVPSAKLMRRASVVADNYSRARLRRQKQQHEESGERGERGARQRPKITNMMSGKDLANVARRRESKLSWRHKPQMRVLTPRTSAQIGAPACERWTRCLPLVSPLSPGRMRWDALIALLVVVLVAMLPWTLAVEWWPWEGEFKSISIAIDLLFWADVALNFMTGFVHHGELVMERGAIVRHYMSTWLPLDLLGNFPWEVLTELQASERKTVKILKWCKLAKLLRTGRIVKYLHTYFEFPAALKLLCPFFATVHVLSCVWIAACWSEDGQRAMGLGYMEMYGTALHTTLLQMVGSAPLPFEREQAFYVSPGRDFPHSFSVIALILGISFLVKLTAYATASTTYAANAYHRHSAAMAQAEQDMEYHDVPEELQRRVQMQKRCFICCYCYCYYSRDSHADGALPSCSAPPAQPTGTSGKTRYCCCCCCCCCCCYNSHA